MARSKIFEALLEEAGKQAQRGGEALKETTPIGVKKKVVPQTLRQTVSKTLRQTDRQSNEHSNGQSNRQTDSQTNTQMDSQKDRHPERQSVRHPERQSNRHSFEDHFNWMSKNQIVIFSFLIENKSRITTLETISNHTGVPYGTVRGVIRKLVQKKCLSPPQRYRDGAAQGFSYNVDEEVCQRFKNYKYYRQSDEQSIGLSDEQTVCRTGKQTVCLISSSSLIKKPTTWLDNELTQNPELGYWRQKELTSKQIQNWIDLTGCDPELIIQYLCYCRYEMVDLGLEESKPVNNALNWFFKIIEKNCSYPKPKGYKSFPERQIEEKTRLLKKKKAEVEELKNIKRALAEAEIEVTFLEMMAQPDSDLYKKCFDGLNDFEKKRSHKGGKVFDAAMLRVLKEMQFDSGG